MQTDRHNIQRLTLKLEPAAEDSVTPRHLEWSNEVIIFSKMALVDNIFCLDATLQLVAQNETQAEPEAWDNAKSSVKCDTGTRGVPLFKLVSGQSG